MQYLAFVYEHWIKTCLFGFVLAGIVGAVRIHVVKSGTKSETKR